MPGRPANIRTKQTAVDLESHWLVCMKHKRLRSACHIVFDVLESLQHSQTLHQSCIDEVFLPFANLILGFFWAVSIWGEWGGFRQQAGECKKTKKFVQQGQFQIQCRIPSLQCAPWLSHVAVPSTADSNIVCMINFIIITTQSLRKTQGLGRGDWWSGKHVQQHPWITTDQVVSKDSCFPETAQCLWISHLQFMNKISLAMLRAVHLGAALQHIPSDRWIGGRLVSQDTERLPSGPANLISSATCDDATTTDTNKWRLGQIWWKRNETKTG